VLALAVKTGSVLESTVPGEESHNRDMGFLRMVEPVMPRFMAQSIRRSEAEILEHTMALDVLRDEGGAAAGIVGLDLVEGRGVVVRAKAVVMCAGSPCWCNGWSGVGAKTNASPENTGDGLAILLGHGVPLKNLEQWDMYFYNAHPSGIAFSQGVGVSVGDHPENMMNAKGEYFLEAGMTDRNSYELLCMKEVYAGRGSANGGLWYDITHLTEPDYLMAFNRRIPENQARSLGYTVENPCEIVPTPWKTAAAPHLDKTGQTEIAGLFFASAGDQGYGGSCATVCSAGGHLAGGSAADYAAARSLPEISEQTVTEIVESAHRVLANKPSSPVRANEVMHVIQNVMNQYCWMGRTDEGLRTAIFELFRVRDELLSRMVVPDKSPYYNQEWRRALEVPFMWTTIMATAFAALTRTESRGSHHRLDYPDMDNGKWLKNVYVRVKDGEWSTECKGIIDTMVASPLVSLLVRQVSVAD
jgi:succinate dehydrogenase / fumarate reductase flavoprotein subunit